MWEMELPAQSVEIVLSTPKLKVIVGHDSRFFRYKALRNLWNLFKIMLLKKENFGKYKCILLTYLIEIFKFFTFIKL